MIKEITFQDLEKIGKEIFISTDEEVKLSLIMALPDYYIVNEKGVAGLVFELSDVLLVYLYESNMPLSDVPVNYIPVYAYDIVEEKFRRRYGYEKPNRNN